MLSRRTFHYPVDALCFATLSELFVLSCEGNALKIYKCESTNLVTTIQIFDVQPVRGLRCLDSPADNSADSAAIILLWGGHKYAILEISTGPDESDACNLRILLAESTAPRRILDAVLRNISTSIQCTWELTYVVDNGDTTRLQSHAIENLLPNTTCSSFQMVPGPCAIALSASIAFKDEGEHVLAAGTIDGKIFIWIIDWEQSPDTVHDDTRQIHKLRGHAGAIFGVDISPQSTKAVSHRRLLATCSDDRAIQIYDITEAFQSHGKCTIPEGCIGRVTGHASRIWSVKFLDSAESIFDMISLGEDAAAQLWRGSVSGLYQSDNSKGSVRYEVTQGDKFSYHSGKNVRSVAVKKQDERRYLVATGGADSRLVTYLVDVGGRSDSMPILSTHQIVESVSGSSERINQAEFKLSKTRNERLFESMIGEWRLSRVIESSLSSHPSGRFQGHASLREYPSAHDGCIREILYSEDGEFTSGLGLVLKARRKYIYKYSRTNDEITAWFVKPDADVINYLFHVLHFASDARSWPALTESSECKWIADGHHLCEQDVYQPTYTFKLDKQDGFTWDVKYMVKGPQKDYVSRATYVLDRSVDKTSKQTALPVKEQGSVEAKRNDPSVASLRAYTWLDRSTVVASSARGQLLIGSIRPSSSPMQPATSHYYDVSWLALGSFEGIGHSSIVSKSTSSFSVLFTLDQGSLRAHDRQLGETHKIVSAGRKICYLYYQDAAETGPSEVEDGKIPAFVHFRRLGESDLNLLKLNKASSPIRSTHVQWLAISDTSLSRPEFVTTSSYYFPSSELMLEGSRHGSLRVSHLKTGNTKLFEKLHGEDAITAIVPFLSTQQAANGRYMLTVGRDGMLRYHKLSVNAMGIVCLETIHESSPPFERKIEGGHVDPINRHIILWGFSGTRFLVWDETVRHELMSLDCGGSHRSWSYFHHGEGGGGSYVCTKASNCLIKYQPLSSHSVIQNGTHGREIKALAIRNHSPTAFKGIASVIATGAEDTNIHLSKYDGISFRTFSVLTKHTTGLQKLEWSDDGRYLFSCAGCEETMVWRIQDLDDQLGIVCVGICPTITAEKALRVMDIAAFDVVSSKADPGQSTATLISAVYSDSSIRIWSFDQNDSVFTLLASASYTTCCLTQIRHLRTQASCLILTAASDGFVTCWELDSFERHRLLLRSRHAVHQGYIHSLAIIELRKGRPAQEQIETHEVSQRTAINSNWRTKSNTKHFLLTGGDDQALGITHIRSEPDEVDSPAAATHLIANAHASAIVDIIDLGESADGTHQIATIGTDQKLKVWQLCCNNDGQLSVTKNTGVTSGVADASSIGAIHASENETRIFVAGSGIEAWDFAQTSFRSG